MCDACWQRIAKQNAKDEAERAIRDAEARGYARGRADERADVVQHLDDLITNDDIQESMAASMGCDDSARYHETRRKAFSVAMTTVTEGEHVDAVKRAKEAEEDA